MAIKPIERYGKFQPTGIDASASDRLKVLAGVGDTVRQTAVRLGNQFSAIKQRELDKQRADTKEAAILDAPTVGFDEGTLAATTGIYTPSLGDGAAQRQMSAQRGYAAGFENAFATRIKEIQAESNGDPIKFLESGTAAIDAMTNSMTKIPPEWVDKARKEATRVLQAQYNPMLKTYNSVNQEKAEVEFVTAENGRSNTQISLAFEGQSDALADAIADNNIAINSALEGGFSSDKIKGNSPEHMSLLIRTSYRGVLKRQVFDSTPVNNLEDLAEVQSVAEQQINELANVNTLYAADPSNPKSRVLVSKDEQQKIVRELREDLESYTSLQENKILETTRKDKLLKKQFELETIDKYMESNQDPDVALQEVIALELTEKTDFKKLKQYLRAKKENTTTDPTVAGGIIQFAYDLNMQFEDGSESEEYLNGLEELQSMMMNAVINGDLSATEQVTLQKQINTIVQAKKSDATLDLAENWSKATTLLKENVSSSLYLQSVRMLHNEVQEKLTAAMDDPNNLKSNGTLKNDVAKQIWTGQAPIVLNTIAALQRDKTRTMIEGIQNTPIISTQAEYDALEPEDYYYRVGSGVIAQKPKK